MSGLVSEEFDLVIVGGGLAGASLAAAVGGAGRRIAVIEPFPAGDERQPSFDERTIALTWASRRVFEGLGAWPALGDDACPITSIHISDRGHFGAARLTAADAGTAALGYVVPARRLGAALAARLDALEGVDLVCPATAERLERSDGAVAVTLGDGRRLEAPLVVLADGGRSTLGTEAGLALPLRHYPHKALVAVVGIDRDHGHRAFERFTEHGPLALLPVTGRRMAVAWTLPGEEAEKLRTAADDVFLAALQDDFGDRAGRFVRAGGRRVYPLSLGRLARPAAARVVAIGNAAHIVHPVAGQGFNLGLRDVAELADLLVAAWRDGEDIGADMLLDRYAASRAAQTRRVSAFTDGLISLFTSSGLGPLRGLGLAAVDRMPPLRRFFLGRTMGLAGRLPRLTRGLGAWTRPRQAP